MGNQIEEIEWRERIEWSNIWWEKANDASQKRIALLGDSVTREFRNKLNARLTGRYVVDICASSSQITDSLLWKEYKFFLIAVSGNITRFSYIPEGSTGMKDSAVQIRNTVNYLKQVI